MKTASITPFVARVVFLTAFLACFSANAQTNHYYYDRNDRLIGAEYANGLAIAYFYDRNGNIVRQTHLFSSATTNELPALWKLLNGLTNSVGTGLYDDPDADGWSNLQEW